MADEQKLALSLADEGWKLLRVEATAQQDWDTCNRVAAAHGLSLTKENVYNLHVRRGEALAATGRVEFGRGIVRELVEAFASSAYVTSDDFEETVADVQDLFYQLKEGAECSGGMADEDLISAMRWAFDEAACGSTALLEGVELSDMRAWVERKQAGFFDQISQFDLDERHKVSATQASDGVVGSEQNELDCIFDEQRMQQTQAEDAVGIVDSEEETIHLRHGFSEGAARIGGSRLA